MSNVIIEEDEKYLMVLAQNDGGDDKLISMIRKHSFVNMFSEEEYEEKIQSLKSDDNCFVKEFNGDKLIENLKNRILFREGD